MGAQNISYQCTALVGTNKKGVLKPIDDKGYYRMTVGGFNIHNANGVYYALGQARRIFEENSSAFQRRVRTGNARGEVGHPRKGNMSKAEYLARLNDIDEKNVCVHFRKFELDFENYKSETGFPQVGVIAELKPAGVHAAMLQASIDNPDEETCFSVRAAAREVEEGGKIVRYTDDAVTYDYVNEGGIGIARKYYSIGLEDISSHLIVTPAIMDEAIEKAKLHAGLESAETVHLTDLREHLGWARPTGKAILLPPSARWK